MGGLIQLDIEEIYKTPNPSIENEYDIIVHTKDDDIGISMIESIEIMRDYNTNLADYVVVNFSMGAGDFVKELQPNRDNAEISIIRVTKDEDIVTRYKLILLNNHGGVYSKHYLTKTRDELNNEETFKIEAQCLPIEMEVMRSTYVNSGIYTDTTVKDILITELYQGDQDITGDNPSTSKSKLVVGSVAKDIEVDIREPHNDTLYRHVEVPTGVKLVDLPAYLQETSYGVYNGHIGSYLQYMGTDLLFWVYPLYNSSLFAESEKKLIIYYPENDKFDHITNTYKQVGDTLRIIANSDINIIDDGENRLIDTGVGLVQADPNLLLTRNVEVKDEEVIFNSEEHLTGTSAKGRRDNINRTHYVGNTSNLFKNRSEILKNMMAIYQLTWNYCDIDLLFPGMPVRYTYEDEKVGIVECDGILQSVYARYNKKTDTTSAILNIAILKPYMEQGV